MAPTQNFNYNFPFYPSPPHEVVAPPPPPAAKPPPHYFSPPPPAHHLPPPPPHHFSPPPPPHILPAPPPSPGHHSTIIIIVFVSLGGLFFLAFLLAALCCFIKKKKMVTKRETIDIDEHMKVQEAIIEGPHGPIAVGLSIEEDVHIHEEHNKNEKVGKPLPYVTPREDRHHHQALDIEPYSSDFTRH